MANSLYPSLRALKKNLLKKVKRENSFKSINEKKRKKKKIVHINDFHSRNA